ncbi:MAG TPA: serine--tRNA ligase, partial [Acinetobacter radioresistens]|nr:serine--tRNA ligase [Acinetobacter radioresistens]
MIDPKLLRNNIEAVNLALAKRGVQLDVEEWAALEVRRKEIQQKTENLQAERNAGAKQVGQLKKAGEDASEIMTRMSAIGDEIKAAELALAELQAELETKSMNIPNLPDESVPAGKDESDNVEILTWGTPRQFDFEIKDHTDLGEWMGGLEFETATKLNGVGCFLVFLG